MGLRYTDTHEVVPESTARRQASIYPALTPQLFAPSMPLSSWETSCLQLPFIIAIGDDVTDDGSEGEEEDGSFMTVTVLENAATAVTCALHQKQLS